MSWLRQFIDFRSKCPLCTSELEIVFVSSKNRPAIIENGKLLITFAFGKWPNNKFIAESKAELRIDIDTLDFDIDFFDDLNIKQEIAIRKTMIDSLKNVLMEDQRKTNNHSMCFLSKKCSCKNYNYKSTTVDLNWKNSKIDKNPYAVCLERFSFSKTDQKVRFFELINYPLFEKCEVYYGSLDCETAWKMTQSQLKEKTDSLDPMILSGEFILPLFNFDSLEKVFEKLETLIVFS